MIYDLIELPIRNVSGELSSVIPRFSRLDGIDDVNWYGREIRLDGIKTLMHKYKSIEPMGSMTIERMFMTEEAIDFKKNWQTSNINIYPIMYKVYKQPYIAYCEVYRYLNGTANALGAIDCYSEIQTINAKLANLMFPFGGDFIDQHTKKLIPYISYGYDNINLIHYNTMHDFMFDKNADSDVCFEADMPLKIDCVFPKFPNDYTEDLFLQDMKVSNLKPILERQCGTGIYRNLMSYIPTPFEVNNTTIFTEDCESYRWCLHELIQAIERSIYTDMHIVIDFENQHKVNAKADMFSRYIGMTTNNIIGAKAATSDMIELLRKWSCLTSKCTPVKVELWKNWAEEIFISITTNQTTNYYFDIITYSLANLSFIDAIG